MAAWHEAELSASQGQAQAADKRTAEVLAIAKVRAGRVITIIKYDTTLPILPYATLRCQVRGIKGRRLHDQGWRTSREWSEVLAIAKVGGINVLP